MDKYTFLQPRSPYDQSSSAPRGHSSRQASPSNSRSPSFWDRNEAATSSARLGAGAPVGQGHSDAGAEYRSPLDLIRDGRDRSRDGDRDWDRDHGRQTAMDRERDRERGRDRDGRRSDDLPGTTPASAYLGHARTLSSLSGVADRKPSSRRGDQGRDGYDQSPRHSFRSGPGSAPHPSSSAAAAPGQDGYTGPGLANAPSHPPPPPLSGPIPGSSKASPHGSAADSPRAVTGNGEDGEDGKGPQRSRSGCLVCRKRKVKCDEVRPRCGKCAIKSRQCVWPDPEVKGNKKRRSSILIQTDARPAQHRRSNGSGGKAGAANEGRSSRNSTPAQAVSKTEPFDPSFPPPSGSSSASFGGGGGASGMEPNPLASLLGAAHASALHHGHGSGGSGPDGTGGDTFLHGQEQGYSTASHGGQGPRSGSSYGPSSPPLTARAPGFPGGLPGRLAQARRKDSSPAAADLRPTGRASLAQILDTHESLNAHLPFASGSQRGDVAGLSHGHESRPGQPPYMPLGYSDQQARAHTATGTTFRDQSGFDMGSAVGGSGSRSTGGVAQRGRGSELALRLGLDSHLPATAHVQRQGSFEQQPLTIEPSSLHQLSSASFDAPPPSAVSQSLFDLGNLDNLGTHASGGLPDVGVAQGQPHRSDTDNFGDAMGVTNGPSSGNMTNGMGVGSEPSFDPLDPDWFSLLFGNTDDLVTQPPPAFPPLHFQAPPLPPPTRFYVPPDFLPKHSLHDADDSHGGEFSRVLVKDDKRAEMMADPAFLAPYFPNLDERIVMRHYLKNTVNIIIAFQCPRKPWNPWVTIHAPLAFNHLPGDHRVGVKLMSRVNPAADALRAAMLAVGGVHLRFTHDSSDQRGAWAIVRASKAKVLTLVRKSIDAQQANKAPMDKGDVEMILAALLSCTIASSLAADESWHELLTSVLSLVDRLGGAQALMREGRHAHDPLHGALDGKMHVHMTSFRFLLEQLAIRDVFGCMTTELAPSMLNVAFSPWFFEAEGWSRGDDEWESIERMFGISRGMVDVIARACTLISQVRKNGITISEDLSAEAGWGTHTKDFTLRLPQRVVSRLDDARGKSDPSDPLHRRADGRKPTVAISPHAIVIPTPPSTTSPAMLGQRSPQKAASTVARGADGKARAISPTTALLQADVLHAANGLIAELSVWDKSSNFTPFHPRTQYGNHTYRHAIKIRLLREVFEVPMDDKRVQDSVSAIVELTVELLAQYGRITWLTWPIVLAAFNMLPKDPQRQVALTLLNEFTYHACFDLTAARKMLCEYWEEEDVATTPGQVVKRQRVRPFLD